MSRNNTERKKNFFSFCLARVQGDELAIVDAHSQQKGSDRLRRLGARVQTLHDLVPDLAQEVVALLLVGMQSQEGEEKPAVFNRGALV